MACANTGRRIEAFSKKVGESRSAILVDQVSTASPSVFLCRLDTRMRDASSPYPGCSVASATATSAAYSSSWDVAMPSWIDAHTWAATRETSTAGEPPAQSASSRLEIFSNATPSSEPSRLRTRMVGGCGLDEAAGP